MIKRGFIISRMGLALAVVLAMVFMVGVPVQAEAASISVGTTPNAGWAANDSTVDRVYGEVSTGTDANATGVIDSIFAVPSSR